jgi:hypothetical protein
MSSAAKARISQLSEQLANPPNPADLGTFENIPNILTIAKDTVGASVSPQPTKLPNSLLTTLPAA